MSSADTILYDFPLHLQPRSTLLADCVAFLQGCSEGACPKQTRHIVTLNPEMLMQGEQNPTLGAILKQADLSIPDGAGIVWALRLKQGRAVQRLPGIELAEGLIEECARHGWPIALIGASPEVNSATVQALQAKFPGLKVSFHHHGFFASPENETYQAQTCAETNPRLVLVALGVPKQELWIQQHRQRFSTAILMGVGGSFDVWSGLKKRAPDFFLKTHTEWLYRITSEPWRIQRICKTLPQFALRVIFSPAT